MDGSISIASTVLAFFIVTISPGPATISNATIAMRHGRKIGFLYGAGLSCGLSFWGLIAASGMGTILQKSLYVLIILKVFGGLYLLWLAFLSARSALRPKSESMYVFRKQNWFLQGLILNMSNPKAVIAWMAALSIGLNSNDGIYLLVISTSICIFIGFIVYTLYSVLFSIGGVMLWYKRWSRWVSGTMSGLFTLAGFGLIRSAFNR
jgi:threonine efflux protein